MGERRLRSFIRKQGKRKLRKKFLIVCEGGKTEPNYFESMRQAYRIAVDVDVDPAGGDALSVVEKAIHKRKDYDAAWAVFDRDEVPTDRFSRALQIAENKGVHIAYSNQAFELWFLLHFDYCDSALHRDQYIAKLRGYMGSYKKNDPSMFEKLNDRIETALHRANRLFQWHCSQNPSREIDPMRNNPSTTVHLLVEDLINASIAH